MNSVTTSGVSVLIIIKGRQDHLKNVIAGIERTDFDIAEIVIAHMNEADYDLTSSIPIRQIRVTSDRPLPLAAARNAAARAAKTPTLVFLDVDCIPAHDFFKIIMHDHTPDNLVMADPRYLAHSPSKIKDQLMLADSSPNPARSSIDYGVSDAYELFWSLGFAINRQTFERIGGFDEAFVGYGGEDTDFAFTARDKAIPLLYSKAIVFHQPHPENDPPLNWFEDIVINAKMFRDKWGTWPMTGWLDGFESRGLIKRHDDMIDIVRRPTEHEIRQTVR